MTTIIGVFQDHETAKRYVEILEKAGYQFRVVLSVPQLLEYLDEHDCVLMVIGAQVPANEKLRIFGYVKRWSRRRCDVVEIYNDGPELPGCFHLRESEGELEILRTIEKVIKAA